MSIIQNNSLDTHHGISIILSPAKTLDLTLLSDRIFAHQEVNADEVAKLSNEHCMSESCDKAKTEMIVKAMKRRSETELKSLLKLSPALAKTSHEHWSAFNASRQMSSNHFALFTFSGPAFQQGIVPQNCDLRTLTYLARHLYILDPVYGVLRSMERIQPYRLEMGCKGVIEEGGPTTKKESLSSFWKESVTAYMRYRMTPNSSVDCGTILVNLASEEYSSSIDIPSLPRNAIFLNVVFRHKGRVVSVHAKRARGLMARYLAERDAQSLSDVSEFGWEGYRCVAVGESRDGSKQLWETMNVVGDNVRVVQMMFDRDDVPGPPSMAKTKRKDDNTECNSEKRIRIK